MAVHRCSFLSGWDRQGGARGRVPALWRGGPGVQSRLALGRWLAGKRPLLQRHSGRASAWIVCSVGEKRAMCISGLWGKCAQRPPGLMCRRTAVGARREWPWRANFNETPPREWRSRANFSETTSWTPSQPIWTAAGQRGAGGPSLVRRDNGGGCPVSSELVHVSLELDQSTRVSHLIWSTRRLPSHLIWSKTCVVSSNLVRSPTRLTGCSASERGRERADLVVSDIRT